MTTKTTKPAKQKADQSKTAAPVKAALPTPAKASASAQKTAFSKMSMAELLEAEVALKNELTRRKREAKRGLMKEMQLKAKAAGLSMADLMGSGKTKAGLPAKYRNPDNPTQTWAGLGKRPTWLRNALTTGKKLEELAVGG